MMKQRLVKFLCAAMAPILLLTGCWQDDLPEEDETVLPPDESMEELVETARLPEIFSLPYDPSLTLDPITCPDGMQQTAASLLYEGLFRLDSQFAAENVLCESYAYDPQELRYTFTLRPGVTFSDGSPLTTADVKATLERARGSERYAARLSSIASITAREDHLAISLTAPNTALPSLLDIPIVKKGTEQNAVPIGTGPYFFSQEEHGAFLIANQSWWQQTTQPTERIALAEADGHDAMLYRFTSHDVQLITADLTGTQPVSVTGNVSCYDAPTTVFQYLGINVNREGLSDPALRRALWEGIHRSHVVSAYLSGHGTASQFPISPASALYPKELESSYSHDSFSSALAQCQSLPGRSLTLLVNEENSFKVSIAQYLADTFTAGGVRVEVTVLPWEEYTAALAAGSFDLYYGEVRLTADWDLSPLLMTGASLNYGGWSDPQTDQLLAAFQSSEDRKAAMEKVCSHLKNQAPILPVCFKATSVLTQSDVIEGLSPTATEPFYLMGNCVLHLQET